MENSRATPPDPADGIEAVRLRLAAEGLRDSTAQMPFGTVLGLLCFTQIPGFEGGTWQPLLIWAAAHWSAAALLWLAASAMLAGRPAPFGFAWTPVLAASMGLVAFIWGSLAWVVYTPGNAANQALLCLTVLTASSIYGLRYPALSPVFITAMAGLAASSVSRHALGGEPWSSGLTLFLVVWLSLFALAALQNGRIVVARLQAEAENRRLAAENAAARDAAQSANTAKSAFLANMSHELRTPLNAVIGFADLIRMAPDTAWEAPRHKEYAGDIAESAHHLLGMINSLLDIAKIEAGKMVIEPEAVAAETEIGAALRLIEPLAAKNGQTLAARIGVPRLVADRRALRSMLLNLLSNAVKYAGPGAAIGVEIRTLPGAVELVVDDTGPGIPETAAARLFDRFERIDNSYTAQPGGTGLGLSLVRELARLHGGDASIASVPGKGTRVSVVLPLRPDLRPAA
jgi:signal transduction histidine kinase